MLTVWLQSLTRNIDHALRLLDAALRDVPDHLWRVDLCPDAPTRQRPEGGVDGSAPWFLGYHVLTVADYDLSGESDASRPPPPFDQHVEGWPARVFEREELLGYLDHMRDSSARRRTDLDERPCARRRLATCCATSALHPGWAVGVHVDREGAGRMAEAFGHDLHRHACNDGERGEGVAQAGSGMISSPTLCLRRSNYGLTECGRVSMRVASGKTSPVSLQRDPAARRSALAGPGAPQRPQLAGGELPGGSTSYMRGRTSAP